MDIRNFFGAKQTKGHLEKQPSMAKKRPKPVALSSSDSEQELKAKKTEVKKKAVTKKRFTDRQVISDSGTFFSFPHKINPNT